MDLCTDPSSHPHLSSQFIPIFQSIALTDSGNIHRFLFSVFGNQQGFASHQMMVTIDEFAGCKILIHGSFAEKLVLFTRDQTFFL